MPDIRRFSEWMGDQRNGLLDIEASEGFHKLIEAVDTLRKPGTLTIKITVKPAGKDAFGAVSVADIVTVTIPKSNAETLFFTDPAGNPVRTNTHQLPYQGPVLEVPERPSVEPKELH